MNRSKPTQTGMGKKGILDAFFSLYGLYCSNYLLALVTVPFLVRVLGIAQWGSLAFAQAFCQYLLLVVELGFPYTATRAASRLRAEKGPLGQLLSNIVAGKLVLAVLCAAAAWIAELLVPLLHADARLLWWGVFWATAQGSNLYWFYQGIEATHRALSVDLVLKALGVGAIFLCVRTPDDAWKVLACQGVAAAISVSILLPRAYRGLPFRLPRPGMVRDAIRESSRSFLPRNSSALYTMGNAFLLGLFAAPQIVGIYAGAERIGRAILGLLGPASDSVFPRLAHMATRSRQSVKHWARVALVVIGGAGMAMGAGIYIFAPVLVRVALGPGLDDAVWILRIFAILPPVVSLRNVLGFHWMMALDLDWLFNRIVLVTGLLNIPLTIVLARTFSAWGVAWAGVASQTIATAATYIVLRWMHLDPLNNDPAPEDVPAYAVANETISS